MRLLHFADLHLDTPFAWASGEVGRAQRQAIRETLLRICSLAVELDVDALTCGGDLYEQDRFSPDTLEFLTSTFAEIAPLPVFVAPGNHDWYGPGSLYKRARWSDNVHIFDAARMTPVTLADGFTLWGAGHEVAANTPDLLHDFHVDRDGIHVGLFHGSVIGGIALQGTGKLPHAAFEAGEIGEAGLHHALLGHFHSPVDALDYTYPGNPQPLTFGETGLRGAVLVTVYPDGTVARERHVVAASAMADVDVDLTGVSHNGEALTRVRDVLVGRTGVVRVDVHGEIGLDVDLRPDDVVAQRPAGVTALVPRFANLRVAYDFEQLRKDPNIRGQFVRSVMDATDLEDDERRRILVTGLRALDNRGAELEVV